MMYFYYNQTARGNPVLFMWMDKEVGERLGQIGTRLSVSQNGDGTYHLKPDAKSRSRLHLARDKGMLEVVLGKVEGWPVTGKTILPYDIKDGNFCLYPHTAEIKKPRSPKQPRKSALGLHRDRTFLPLDLPPAPAAPAEEPKRPSTLADLSVALAMLNEIIEGLTHNGNREILVHTEFGRVRAKVIQTTEL